ncbi:MAG: serine hydrolase domain-containing protein, partial [Acidobacteriota bacterium]
MNFSLQINKTFGIVLLFLMFAATVCGQKAQFDQIFDYYTTEKKFSGTAIVATDGKIEYLNGTGLANRENGTTLTTKSKFRICSITKTFTAVLIMQLYEQGKIDLNAPISKYFPEYKGEARDKITIDNLLTYSSGLDNNDQREEAIYSSLMSPEVLIDKFFSGKLISQPGTKFSYKNADFVILGKIIEKITGKSYAAVLQENILKPLQMTNSGYLRNSDIVGSLVTPYLFNKTTGNFGNDDPYWIDNFYAAAAMYSTVEDLLKFDQAIFNARILRKKTIDLMLTAHPALYNVGYGFWISPVQFGAIKAIAADRQGSIAGSNATWIHLIDQKKTIIILANSDAANINEMREKFVLASLAQPLN